MPGPDPISAGLGVIGGLFAASGTAKANDRAAAQKVAQQQYADQLTGYGNQAQQVGADVLSEQGGYTDPYGGGLAYDPVTKSWKLNTSATDAGIQGASDTEEQNRLTLDQAMRRRGATSAEQLRAGAAGDANAIRTDAANFRTGVGRVDPGAVASSLRLDRAGAVNAGYDEAARSANTLSLRQGGAGGGDAATILARNRAADIARTMGNPDVEGLQTADQLNNGRQQVMAGQLGAAQGAGSQFVDTAFNPSQRFNNSLDRMTQQQQLANQRKTLGLDAFATGGQLVGSAAAGIRGASQAQNAATKDNVYGDLFNGLSKSAGAGSFGSFAGMGG